MTPRVTASLLAAPLAAAAVAGALTAGDALADRTGMLPAQRTVSTLLLVVVAALALRTASRRAAASERPLRGVALAGIVLGLWLLLLQWLLPAFAAFLPTLGAPLARALATVVFEAPWVLALAWALPFLVRAAVTSTPRAPAGAGLVIAAIAAGAAVAFVVSSELTLALGVAGLGRALGVASLALALVLLLLDRPLPHGSAPPPGTQLGVMADGQNPSPAAFALGLLLGAAAVAWLALLAGPSGGPRATMRLLGTVVLGASTVGALLGAWLARRIPRPDLRLLLGLALTGYLSLLSLPLLGRLPLALIEAGADAAARQAALRDGVLLAIAPPALVGGITLLLGVRVRCDWTGAASSSAGMLLTWTAAGVVLGAGLGRLLLLPRALPAYVLLAGAGAAIGVAAALRLRATQAPRAGFALLTILPLAALLWPGLRGTWLDSGPGPGAMHAASRPLPIRLPEVEEADLALLGELFTGRERRERHDGGDLPRTAAFGGPLTLLAEPDGTLRIQQGGRVLGLLGADDAADARIEVALGLLPAVLHPHPGRALVLGPGSGLLVETLLAARVARVHVAAPVPAALEVARQVRGLAEGVAEDPRVTLHVHGGRAMLPRGEHAPAAGASTYDVIVCGLPFDPALFTQEGVAGIHAALAPKGVAAFHVPFEGFDADSLRRVLATVRKQFGTTWVFRFEGHVAVLCAETLDLGGARFGPVLGDGPGRSDPPRSAALARGVGLGTRGRLLRHLALDTEGVDRILPAGASVLSDDKPWLAHRVEANRRAARDPRHELGRAMEAGFPPHLERLEPDVRRRDAWIAQIVEGWLAEDPHIAGIWDRAVRYGVTRAGWIARARAAVARGEPERAVRFLDQALRDAKDPVPLIVERLAALATAGSTGRMPVGSVREQVRTIGSAHPRNGVVLAAVGRAHQRLGDLAAARAALETALEQTTPPPPPGTAVLLARVLLAGAEPDTGRARELMESDPALYEDPDALDLFVGLLSPEDHTERAPDLELATETLRRLEADRLLRDVRSHVGLGAFQAAFSPARLVTDLQPDRASAWELLGLIELGRSAGASDAARTMAKARATEAFRQAVGVSLAPEVSRDRARRIARWFGLELDLGPEDTRDR